MRKSKPKSPTRLSWTALFVNIFACSLVFAGDPEVYEPFNYTGGTPFAGLSGGGGFASPWLTKDVAISGNSDIRPIIGAEILEDSLHYSDGLRSLVVEGGSLFLSGEFGNARVGRRLDLETIPHSGEDPKIGKTTYLSFLARRTGEPADPADPVYGGNYPYGDNLYPRSAGIGFYSWNDEELLQLFMGNLSNHPTDVWRFTGEDLYGDERRDARSTVAFGKGQQTRLVVIRIDHGAGGWLGDRLNVWIDPDLASEHANPLPVTFDWTTRDEPLFVQPAVLTLEANNGDPKRPHSEIHFDEYRMGSSWESVTPFTGGDQWAGRPVSDSNWVATGDRFLGWVKPVESGWAMAEALNAWVFMPEAHSTARGSWVGLWKNLTPPPVDVDKPSILKAYEGFDYPSSGEPFDLAADALDGGLGWAGPWENLNQVASDGKSLVNEDSLNYEDANGYQLQTSGGHAYIAGVTAEEAGRRNGISTRIRRTLSVPPGTNPGKPVYISFIGQRTGMPANPDEDPWTDTEIYPDGYPFGDNLYPRNAGLTLMEDLSGSGSSAHLGNISDQPENLWTLHAESTQLPSALPFTEQAFVVLRLDYTSHQRTNLVGELQDLNGTVASMWINPEDLLVESGNTPIRSFIYKDLVDPFALIVSGFGLEAGDDSHNRPPAEFIVDEIRLGNDWDSVTPVRGGKPPRNEETDTYWGGLEVYWDKLIWAGEELQWLLIEDAPWLYCPHLSTWVYCEEAWMAEPFLWLYIVDSSRN